MNCKKVSKLLDDHLDGLLAAPVSERIRAHLGDCPACEADAGHSRAAMESMESWGDLEPPAGCFDRILGRIEALPPDALTPAPVPLGLRIVRSRVARWVATSGAAAAAALLIGVSMTGLESSDNPRRTRTEFSAPRRHSPIARKPGLLPGEEALTLSLFSEADYERRDGLLRRRVTDPIEGPSVPVAVDALEMSPK